MKMPKIPKIDSIEELARFWDTHDLTDFKDDLEEIPEPIFERGAEVAVTVRLYPEDVAAVKRIARSRGVEHTALIREWVLEKLRHKAHGGLMSSKSAKG